MFTPDPASAAPRVVVVEDDPTIGVLMASVLADAGYVPFVVQDGHQALQVVRDLQPDAITLDLELPGLDGHTVLQRLECEEAERPLPVVIVSGSTEGLSKHERILVAETLTKPFDLTDLVRAVDSVVDRSHQ
jgi:DNA-binding response OmpR family regulator